MYSFTSCALALSSLTLLIDAAAAAADGSSAKCYYPNGDYQPNDTPCNPKAKESNCCAPDDICLSNGLCYRANINRLHRGSCTDPTFSSQSCTSICTGPDDIATGFADVLECTLTNDWYCGWGNQSRCNEGKTFQIPDGYFADDRNVSSLKAVVTVTEGCPGTPKPTSKPLETKTSMVAGIGPASVGTGSVVTGNVESGTVITGGMITASAVTGNVRIGSMGTGSATSLPASVATSDVTINTTASALPPATTTKTFTGRAETIHVVGKTPMALLGLAAVMCLF